MRGNPAMGGSESCFEVAAGPFRTIECKSTCREVTLGVAIGDYGLSADELRQFQQDGVIGPFDLYERDEALDLYKKSIRPGLFDRSHAAYDLPTDAAISNYDRHLDINALSDHVRHPRIVDRVRSILGPDVLCWRSEFFPKYPGDAGTQWHQADTFAHASGQPQIRWSANERFGGAITVWTGFTDCTKDNGCMRFIPGTHESMMYDESKGMTYRGASKDSGFFGYDYRDLQIDPDWKPDEAKAISKELRAGQFIIFWSTLMHASFPNSTAKQTRMAFAARYVPTSVSVYPDTQHIEEYGSRISLERYGTVLVSGVDRYGQNRILEKNLRNHPLR